MDPYPKTGNECMAINDYRLNPLHLPVDDKTRAKKQLCGKNSKLPNVNFVEVLYKGWPYVFVAATAAIKQDEELLIDYGEYIILGGEHNFENHCNYHCFSYIHTCSPYPFLCFSCMILFQERATGICL